MQDVCKNNLELVKLFADKVAEEKSYQDSLDQSNIDIIEYHRENIKACLFTLTGCVDISSLSLEDYCFGTKREINLESFITCVNNHSGEDEEPKISYNKLSNHPHFIKVFNECAEDLFGWKYEHKYPSEHWGAEYMLWEDETISECFKYECIPYFKLLFSFPLILLLPIVFPIGVAFVMLAVVEYAWTKKWSFSVRGN